MPRPPGGYGSPPPAPTVWMHYVEVDLPYGGKVQLAGTDANRVFAEAAQLLAAAAVQGGPHNGAVRHLRSVVVL
jgi:hypothetical protein